MSIEPEVCQGSAESTRPTPRRSSARTLEPVLGVTLAHYAQASKRLSAHGYDPASMIEIAGELGIAPAVWEEAKLVWDRRLVSDPAVADAFSHCYKRIPS